ncbi:unnamed protein product [Vitrella brassicaformis CCMP3155]|uniref:Ribosomal protein eL8/eL30/eS12/Gadd45 domain-containing protein n=1 Tax=Vitrella brassicaformis (strain CCMP3155) TaxID=1169540 RepID=A0A0G4EVZ3_VITBC|nr:unnamed protein product [Vitrella brassicaformis CCMP3155]|mmetsp:Transcript_50882/g.127640  ORF Transcript_50882/g.127640 Transcript_50882/m.127640 type:complete len:153 (-) Transcript_50882:596-1054(-)|eukprot:CEM02267.1 unnamed protein product [Vitrella brassicaformis CCMP3155]
MDDEARGADDAFGGDEDMSSPFISPIAQPLLDINSKLLERSLKLLRKAAGEKKSLRRGVAEVTKAIRKDTKGVVFLAADVFPVDIVAHLPILCEKKDVPYCFVPSRRLLGSAAKSKRPASVLLVVQPKGEESTYKKLFERADEGVRKINPYF